MRCCQGDALMGRSASADVIKFAGVFGRFRLDVNNRRLHRLDPAIGEIPVRLGNPGFELLCLLLEQKGGSVTKQALKRAAWKIDDDDGSWDDNLRVEIGKLRSGLGENAHNSCIQRAAGGGYCYIEPKTRAPDKAPATAAKTGEGGSPRPDLSIIVLPFANLSEDRGQQYFADGLTEDLTTDLSRFEDMFVISRNTAFTYRNKPVNTRRIGRSLGVRYVLEGSARRSGTQVRVNARLIDAEADRHLWAERFDSDISELFALQDEVTSRIAVALNLELINAALARQPEHPGALDYIFRGRAVLFKPPTRESYLRSIDFFERAIEIDPRSAEARSRLSGVFSSRAIEGMTDTREADIVRAEQLAVEAVAISPRSFFPHFAKGLALRTQRRCEEAILEYERAIALNRNWVNSHGGMAECKLLAEPVEEATPFLERAIRLSPRDGFIGHWYNWFGRVYLLRGHVDEAIAWFENARRANPALPYVHAYLASAYALKGENERAAAELAETWRLSPDGRYSSIAGLKAAEYFGSREVQALVEATYFAGLRKAGIPRG
jgi:adenylate cyclase